jgi:hypothetical protein
MNDNGDGRREQGGSYTLPKCLAHESRAIPQGGDGMKADDPTRPVHNRLVQQNVSTIADCPAHGVMGLIYGL